MVIWPKRDRSLNPWLHIIYKIISQQGYQVVGFKGILNVVTARVLILNWIESPLNKGGLHYVFVIYRLFVVLMALVADVKIVWVVHNIKPHDKRLSKTGYFFIKSIIL